MAKSLAKRIARTVSKALQERDRAEMRAVETLLAVVEPKRRRRAKGRRRQPVARRRS